MKKKDNPFALTDENIDRAYNDMLKAYKIKRVTVEFEEEKKGKKHYNRIYRAFQWALCRGTFANDLKLDFSKIMKV